ncbi:hypothetical protein [Phytohabitans aurantiacus]|uniref:Lipoprotein n=1 Tax=Phytohabitans aurantiacus TaxID=3016789 RepID=A0ABQ5QZQ6_9ACTN|nr:hypothetical protein [Phytohabitans aurantiacus]GLH98820.1 hypothetical protein Pa4123_40950 [Phytohabitans aurantiacus]
MQTAIESGHPPRQLRRGTASRQPTERDDRQVPRESPGRSHRLALATAFAAVVLAAAACGSDPKPEPPASTAAADPGTASAPVDQRAAAVAAYQGMWLAYQQAGLTADPGHPDLPRYATGDALEILRDGLEDYRDQGQVLKGQLVTHPQVQDVSPPNAPTTVRIRDCLDTRDFLVYWRADGRLVDDEPGGARDANATVTLTDGQVWKVSSFGVQAVKAADVC